MLQSSGLIHCTVRDVVTDISAENAIPFFRVTLAKFRKTTLIQTCYGSGDWYRLFTEKTGFDSRPVYVRSELAKAALRQLFLQVFRFSALRYSNIFHTLTSVTHGIYSYQLTTSVSNTF